jgi:hypothetical protein
MNFPEVSAEELTALPEYYTDYLQLRKASTEMTYFAKVSLVIPTT